MFTDGDGNIFIYEVSGKETISGADLIGLIDREGDMLLFICTFDGCSGIVVECSRLK